MDTYENLPTLVFIFIIILIGTIISWKCKNSARKSILYLKVDLATRFDKIAQLLDENPEIAPAFCNETDELYNKYINTLSMLDENSIDVCWETKRKEALILKDLVFHKHQQIKRDIIVLKEARIQVPILMESVPIVIFEVFKRISEGKLCRDKSKTHLDNANRFFEQARATMRREKQDYALAFGYLEDAMLQLDIASSFEL